MATPLQKSRVELVLVAITKGLERIDAVSTKVDKVVKAQERAARATRQATAVNRNFSAGVGRMARRMVALLAVYGSIQTVQATLRPAIDMETFETEFSVLLGSVDSAQKRIGQLSQFAAGTPFEMPQIVMASRTLQTLTQGALATGEGLRLVGDVAAGTGQPIDELAVWFGRLYDGIQSGRPVGEAMMRLQELGAVSGDTRGRIEAMQKAGADGSRIWQDLAASFGKFAGLMEAKSKTLGGQLSNLGDNFFNLRAQFGAGIRDALTPILTEINAGLSAVFASEKFKAFGERIGAMISLAFQSWKDGTFAELIMLTLRAGFELGIDFGKAKMVQFFSWLAQDGWKSIVVGLAAATEALLEILLQLLGALFDFIRAGFTLVFDRLGGLWDQFTTMAKNVWIGIANTAIGAFENVINWLAQALEGLANSWVEGLNKALGVFGAEIDRLEIDPITLRSIKNVTEEVRKTARWTDHVKEANEDNLKLQNAARLALRGGLANLKALVGVQTEANKNNKRSLEQLIEALDAMQQKQAQIASTITTKTVVGESPDEEGAGEKSGTKEPKTIDKALDDALTKFTNLQHVGEQLGGIFNKTFRGISHAIEGLINKTMTWGQALQKIGTSFIGSLVKSFADMAAAWVTQHIVMLAIKQATDLAEVGSHLAKNTAKVASDTVAGAASATAWGPAALMQSIVSWGAAPLIGLAALAAAVAAFEGGGRVFGGEKIVRVNEGGASEFIVSGRSPVSNEPFLNFANSGGRIADLIGARAPSSTGFANPGAGGAAELGFPGEKEVVIFWGNESEAENFAANIPGKVTMREIARDEIKRWRS